MQKVLITGAASGLGRALALRFAKEGADICVADINAEGSKETVTMIEAAGGKGWTAHLDVTVPEQWEALRHDVEERWGSIDVVINNAGVATGDRIDAGEWAWWEWIIDINLKGVALGCRTFTPMMKNHQRLQYYTLQHYLIMIRMEKDMIMIKEKDMIRIMEKVMTKMMIRN